MAITVYWDDGSSATWSQGKRSYQPKDRGPRASYQILDENDKVLVVVPDYGVRYVGDGPDLWTGPGEE